MLRHWGCRLAPDPSRVVTKKKKAVDLYNQEGSFNPGYVGVGRNKKRKKENLVSPEFLAIDH